MRHYVLLLACVLATAAAAGTETDDQYQVLTPEDKTFKPIHEQSVAEGMDLITESGLKPSRHDRRLLIEGVQQPDIQAAFPTKVEILMQGMTERFVQSKKHDFMALRVATQHIHAVSFALKEYNKTSDKVVTVPGYPIPADNGYETLSFVNNRQVHNKMLETIAGWFWIALADRNETNAGWKMGNVLHSLGDSFAGGHTHRSKPVESHSSSSAQQQQQQQQWQQPHSRFGDVDCSTSEVIMFNSMDVANWNNHLSPDLQTKDWRFHCLKKHIAELVRYWKAGRPEVQKHKQENKRIDTINTVMRKVGSYLCSNALKFNQSRLEWPAGGQVAGFSALSELKMTKASKSSWAHLNVAKIKKALGGKGDQPIMPIGLTTPERSEQFIKEVAQVCFQQDEDNQKLKTVILHGFTYPSRTEPSYCDPSRNFKDFEITGPVYTAINQGLAPKDHWVDWKGMGDIKSVTDKNAKSHPLLDEVSGDAWMSVARKFLKQGVTAAAGVYHTYLWPKIHKRDAAGEALVQAMIDGKAPYDRDN